MALTNPAVDLRHLLRNPQNHTNTLAPTKRSVWRAMEATAHDSSPQLWLGTSVLAQSNIQADFERPPSSRLRVWSPARPGHSSRFWERLAR